MNDMVPVIKPKSDQLNADDLDAGPITITITRVNVRPDAPEQPVSIYFEGDGGKPYKPCKSMCRVMVQAWGPSSAEYVGKAMTLYRDPNVTFGGVQVGGIRISHMSHIDREMRFALTVSQKKRAAYAVRPLERRRPEPEPDAEPSKYWIGRDSYPTAAEWEAAFKARITDPGKAALFRQHNGKSLQLLADDGDEAALRIEAALEELESQAEANL